MHGELLVEQRRKKSSRRDPRSRRPEVDRAIRKEPQVHQELHLLGVPLPPDRLFLHRPYLLHRLRERGETVCDETLKLVVRKFLKVQFLYLGESWNHHFLAIPDYQGVPDVLLYNAVNGKDHLVVQGLLWNLGDPADRDLDAVNFFHLICGILCQYVRQARSKTAGGNDCNSLLLCLRIDGVRFLVSPRVDKINKVNTRVERCKHGLLRYSVRERAHPDVVLWEKFDEILLPLQDVKLKRLEFFGQFDAAPCPRIYSGTLGGLELKSLEPVGVRIHDGYLGDGVALKKIKGDGRAHQATSEHHDVSMRHFVLFYFCAGTLYEESFSK